MEQLIDRRTQGVIVDVIAIVLSILLAFTIDAWWDERKERAEEQEVLASLYVEFEANRDEAASVVEVHEAGISSVAAVMEMSDEEILALSTDEVEQHIRFFANPRTFDAIRGTVDALTSSGKLGILRSRKLREALTTFVNIVEDAAEDRIYLSQSSMTIWNEIARNGGPWHRTTGDISPVDCSGSKPDRTCYINEQIAYLPAATPQDLLRLRNNATVMGYINQGKINAAHYATETRQAQLQIEIILNLLEENLQGAK